MKQARDWINHYERFWNERLDALEALLKAEDNATGEGKKETGR